MQNTTYYKITRWLVDIYAPFQRQLTLFCPRDSFELPNLLTNVSLSFEKMYSVDIESVFTKVPLCETVDFLSGFISPHNFHLLIQVDYIKDHIVL